MLSLITGGAVKAARAVGNRVPHALLAEASAARTASIVGAHVPGTHLAIPRALHTASPGALPSGTMIRAYQAASIAAPLPRSPAQLSGLIDASRAHVLLLGRSLSGSSVSKAAGEARSRDSTAKARTQASQLQRVPLSDFRAAPPLTGLAPTVSSGLQGAEQGELQQTSDPFDSLTDKIPVRPVSAAEAGSYSIVIFAGFAVALAAAYAILKELFFEPSEQTVFSLALDKCQIDPRVMVRLGSPVTGYGVDARSRTARHHIRHRQFQDGAGVTHLQVQFQLRGPNGVATAHADAVKEGGGWVLQTLYVDVGSPVPQRLVIMAPEATQQWLSSGAAHHH